MSGERRMAKFSKKLLGSKIRTQMVMHRIVIKSYENGITIKPIGTQGAGKVCPSQEALFLTNENAGYLLNYLQIFNSAKEIVNSLDNKEEEKEGFTDEFGRSARYG